VKNEFFKGMSKVDFMKAVLEATQDDTLGAEEAAELTITFEGIREHDPELANNATAALDGVLRAQVRIRELANTYHSNFVEDVEFQCPECGSHQYGSTDRNMTRHCHGSGCKFTWKEIDDPTYLHGTGIFREKAGTAVGS
jgi:DNA-directed RNA polymerase subunit M/transcription elongation factor TFIIS